MSSRRSLSAMALTILACAAAGATPAQAAGDRHLDARKTVDGTDKVVASFRTASCRRGKPNAQLQFYARSESTNGDYVLRVSISEFKGYRQYRMPYGQDADPYVSVAGPNGTYTSLVGPPFLPFGGAMRFSPKGKSFSLGMVGVFAPGLQDGVALAGAVDCKYPKKKKPKKKS